MANIEVSAAIDNLLKSTPSTTVTTVAALKVLGATTAGDASIVAADLAAGAVTTAKIADANVTLAKITGLGTAATAASTDFATRGLDIFPASSAIRSYTSRDRFGGTKATTADNITLTSDISGTVKTVDCSLNGRNLWNQTPGSMVMYNPLTAISIKDGTTSTHAAGFTGIAYIRIADAKSHSAKIGFTSSSFLSSGFYRIHQGVIIGAYDGSNGNTVKGMVSVGESMTGTLMSGVKDGDIIGIAMQLTASGYDLWMQGGPCDAWGATAGSAAWIKIYQNTAGTIAGNLAFAVEGVGGFGPVCLLEFATTSSFQPDERSTRSIFQSVSLYSTHASNAYCDSAGNLWTTWWAGDGADAVETGITYLRVRTPTGIWSNVTVVDGPYGTGTGYRGDSGGFFETENGTVYLIKQRSIDNEVTYAMSKLSVSVSAAGVVTLGTPSLLPSVTRTFALNYQPGVRITQGAYAGRILLPCNTLTRWFILYSDDEGVTWAESALFGGTGGSSTYGIETSVVEEGSSKQLAAYVRRSSSGAYVPTPRYVSSDGGVTWTESGSIAVPSNDSRAQAIRLENGLVAYIANDSILDYVRSDTTIWLLSDGGATVGKIPVLLGGSGHNYPAIASRGNNVAVVMPVRQSSANMSPGQVFVIDQPLSEWMRNTRDRIHQPFRSVGVTAVNSANYLTSAVASASAVAMTTNTSHGIVSISLPPGAWILEGNVNVNFTSATVTELQAGIMTSGSPTDGTEVYTDITTTTLTSKAGITLPRKRFVVNATTTVYLTAKANFSAGTAAGFGSITASKQ